jgi:hypothetical protein
VFITVWMEHSIHGESMKLSKRPDINWIFVLGSGVGGGTCSGIALGIAVRNYPCEHGE